MSKILVLPASESFAKRMTGDAIVVFETCFLRSFLDNLVCPSATESFILFASEERHIERDVFAYFVKGRLCLRVNCQIAGVPFAFHIFFLEVDFVSH